ncbi:glycosyltransferase family 39 protein [Roseibium sp. M-1]
MQQITGRYLTGENASRLTLTLILIVAAALRLPWLDRTSIWYDEAVSWSQSQGSFDNLLGLVAADNYPPLHNILLWLTTPVIGDSETALRLPSAVLGVIAVWLCYFAGKQTAGRSAGLLAAALLAVSPFHIWYSTEARMYALLATTGLAFLLSAMKVLERPKVNWAVALALSGALFLYSHFYALLGFGAVGLACAVLVLIDTARAGHLRMSNALAACLAMGASALAFLPWLLILAGRARSVAEAGFWIAYPDLPFLRTVAFSMAGSLVLFWLLAGLALVGVGMTVVAACGDRTGTKTGREQLICIAYTAGPPLLAYLYSVLVQPILFDRYLIAAWPGLLLLASSAVCRLPLRIVPLLLFAVALILALPELRFTLQHKIRPEWRSIAEAYEARREAGDRLVLYKGFAAPALAYYLRGTEAFAPAETLADLKRLSEDCTTGNCWLLLVHGSEMETREAMEAFGVNEEVIVAQRFGWGTSGLRLLKRSAEKL